MSKNTRQDHADFGSLAEDARALMAATAEVAGDKITEARKRVAIALDNGKEFYGQVRDKAIEGAKAADKNVRANPYKAVGIAVGVGVLVGYLLGRRK